MNNNVYTLLLPVFILSLLSVPLGAMLAFIMTFTTPEFYNSKNTRYALYMILALAISYINTTKPLFGSDLGYYYWLFDFAGKKSFINYFSLIPKEPLYHIYNYLLHIITLGSFNLFLVITTVLCYMLIFVSYDTIVRHSDIDIRYVLFSAALFLLFIEFFFYTAQIIRQVLAGAVAFYGITKHLYESKRFALWLVAVAGLIHASAFFFLLYYVIYLLRNLKFTKLLFLVIGFLLVYKVFPSLLGNVFDDTSTLSIAINRGLRGSGEQVSIGMIPLLVTCSILPMSGFVFLKSEDITEKLFFVFPMALVVFIMLNINTPLFVLRFMEYNYMFIPIALSISSAYLFRSFPMWTVVLLLAVMLVRFCTKLGTSDFSYIPLFDYLSIGIPRYIVQLIKL